MYLIHDILTPIKGQVSYIRTFDNLPPEPSLKKALHKQRVISLAYVCAVARIHDCLIWLCEIERNIDIVGEVDFEKKVKEVLEFLHVLVVTVSGDLEAHCTGNHRFGDMNDTLSC